ncbi:hypothetical protein ABW19_dt0204139 [Dactylella cylindrospora]|nr:hypothetical protein ABW19_dt0204139 [Dactylella cylindrospora]
MLSDQLTSFSTSCNSFSRNLRGQKNKLIEAPRFHHEGKTAYIMLALFLHTLLITSSHAASIRRRQEVGTTPIVTDPNTAVAQDYYTNPAGGTAVDTTGAVPAVGNVAVDASGAITLPTVDTAGGAVVSGVDGSGLATVPTVDTSGVAAAPLAGAAGVSTVPTVDTTGAAPGIAVDSSGLATVPGAVGGVTETGVGAEGVATVPTTDGTLVQVPDVGGGSGAMGGSPLAMGGDLTATGGSPPAMGGSPAAAGGTATLAGGVAPPQAGAQPLTVPQIAGDVQALMSQTVEIPSSPDMSLSIPAAEQLTESLDAAAIENLPPAGQEVGLEAVKDVLEAAPTVDFDEITINKSLDAGEANQIKDAVGDMTDEAQKLQDSVSEMLDYTIDGLRAADDANTTLATTAGEVQQVPQKRFFSFLAAAIPAAIQLAPKIFPIAKQAFKLIEEGKGVFDLFKSTAADNHQAAAGAAAAAIA